MKISEAIRIGSQGTYQIVGRYHDQVNGYCALGCIVRANGHISAFGHHIEKYVSDRKLRQRIEIMNDSGYTTEQIANILESEGL